MGKGLNVRYSYRERRKKGYRFIRQQDIFDKIFFHVGAVQGSFKDLNVNDKVDFKIIKDTKGYKAVNI